MRRAGGVPRLSRARAILGSTIVGTALLTAPAAVGAQGSTAACTSRASTTVGLRLCQQAVASARILVARVPLAAGGGNPVPGTASTLGMRIGSTPRISLALRGTLAGTTLPPIRDAASTEDIGFATKSLSLDGSVAIWSGLSPFATVGGIGSLDAIGSIGWVLLPEDDGFSDGSALSWALGARLGVLRESFTAPGLSVTVMRRHVATVRFGDRFGGSDSNFSLGELKAWSARALVGKQVATFGITAGLGYNWSSAEVLLMARDADDTITQVGPRSLSANRLNAFANISYTLLVFSLVGEIGWQQGGTADDGDPAADQLRKGALFGSLALRLVI